MNQPIQIHQQTNQSKSLINQSIHQSMNISSQSMNQPIQFINQFNQLINQPINHPITLVFSQKYTGWRLADEEFTGYYDLKRARLMFFIMVAGVRELPGLDATLRSLYHVDHFFLIHMDVKVNPY